MQAANKELGVLASYSTAHSIYHACEQVRDAGFRKFDSYTPFPVHGLDKAMGLGPSYLPWLVLIAGVTGGSLALLLSVWTSAYDYPLNIGGKPLFSIPAFIPVVFECTILLSGLTAVFGMFFLNKMPTYHHPLFAVAIFAKVTDDKFFIFIDSKDRKYERHKIIDFLMQSGADTTVVVQDEQA